MRVFVVMVAEIEGDKSVEFVTAGKYAVLKRVGFSAAEAASACARVVPGVQHGELVWTDDAPEEELLEWQVGLMNSVEQEEE
jgi:hypothetical protein